MSKVANRLACILFTVIGLLCIIIPGRITAILPYLLGGAMTAAGAACSIVYFLDRDAWTHSASELASGLILLVVGILCMAHGADSIVPMGTAWAILGLRKASRSMSRAIQNYGRGAVFYLSLGEFFVRLLCSVMLLFYPTEKFAAHIVLLGLELIVVSIRFAKQVLDVEE